jgi:hypothetical protein
MRTEPYPSWDYFPRNVRPPEWVKPFIANVRAAEQSISTVDRKTGLDSDQVLQQLASGLREHGCGTLRALSGKRKALLSRRFSVRGHASPPHER